MWIFIFVLILIEPKFLAAVVTRNAEHYCLVTETNRFSYDFDFRKLTNTTNDYIIKHELDIYITLQMCKQLNNECNGRSGYSICLSKYGQQIGIGKEPPEIVQSSGKIIFKYTGDKCDNNHNYEVNINMLCDFNVNNENGIELYATGYNDCVFNMNWRNEAACTKRRQIDCKIDNNSNHYDLSSLINFSDNYEVFINERYSAILNICHSILYRKNTCTADSSACLIDKTNSKLTSKTLGKLYKDSLLYNTDDQTISLTYKEGGICSENFPGSPSHVETTITFKCNLDAIGTLPKYIGGMEKCRYHFFWETSAACDVEALKNKTMTKEKTETCSVKDPKTGELYDLNELKGKEHTVNFNDVNIFGFSICNSLKSSKCKKGSGSCRRSNNTSGGIGNSKLMWKESGPYLNYTNGDICSNILQRYTLIEFYCGFDSYTIEEESCHDVIKVHTPLVCKKNTCSSYNNKINLKPLMREMDNYIIKSDEDEYHINICRPLVPTKDLGCSHGAAICKNKIINGRYGDVTNLGYPDQNPIRTSDQSAILIYHNGSVCPEDIKRKVESSISFLCDANIKKDNSYPKYLDYKNCTYRFEWKVDLVCSENDATFNDDCSLLKTLGEYKNLTELIRHENLIQRVKSVKGDKMYKITYCKNQSVCNGAFICDDQINYGTNVKVLDDNDTNYIRLKFTKGSICNGTYAESLLSIVCNKYTYSDTLVSLQEQPCYVEFEWQTNKICSSLNKSLPSVIKTTTTTLSGIEIAGIVIVIVIILTIIFYLQSTGRLSRLINVIFNSSRRNSDSVKYSRVNTTEEVHLLMDNSEPTVIDSDTDSDDELLES